MKNKMKLLLTKENTPPLEALVDQISPRGCSFQWANKDLDVFRENNKSEGKYSSFSLVMTFFLPSLGEVSVTAEGQVSAVHRCTQDEFQIKLVFSNIQQDGYRLLAELISPDQDVIPSVISFQHENEIKSA